MAYLGSTDAHGHTRTAANLAAWGVDWLEHYNLSLDEGGCIIAADAAPCARASQDLKDEAQHIQTVTCLAHTLQNCLMDIKADLPNAWRKLVAVAEFVTSSQSVLATLRTFGREQGISAELKRPGAARLTCWR